MKYYAHTTVLNIYFKIIKNLTNDGKTLVMVQEYIEEAAKATGANNISSCCKGRLKTSGGYVWRYLEEVGVDD